MAFRQTYKKFAAGGFATFSYSPKHLDKLTEFDRRPLIIFINYDTEKKYISALNIHWMTVSQRRKLISIMKKVFNIGDFHEFGEPIKGFTYEWIKRTYPQALIAYRRYFTNRIRNVSFTDAWQWDPVAVNKEIIKSDTQRIIGVSPEQIQKLAIRAMKARAKTKVKKSRAKAKSRKRRVRR